MAYRRIPLVSINMCFHNTKFLAFANHQLRKLIYHTQKKGDARCELLICSECPKGLFEHYPKHKFIECRQGETIGNKRNMLLEASKGDYICIVDSDDLQMKYRIKLQLELLEMLSTKNCSIVTTNRLFCYNIAQNRSYYVTCEAEGALMFSRKLVDEGRRFGTEQVGEGLALAKEQRIYFENDHYMMIALQHGDNTTTKDFADDYGNIDDLLDETEKELIKDLIS